MQFKVWAKREFSILFLSDYQTYHILFIKPPLAGEGLIFPGPFEGEETYWRGWGLIEKKACSYS